ncbi:major facilitator-type transporter hxnz-related [Anaeramoeba flamelloides]|uniref:Major facilitator-type transporter hxnz-related n=1 Tax=Anaeramoeba flamelloides TaxID=1746091 RepID=A0AAV8A2K9_9EUKA|nr:major facilitator-type transporter hxnz-related [Anaeramoeba flamelloides]
MENKKTVEQKQNLNKKTTLSSIVSLLPFGLPQIILFVLCGSFYAYVGMEIILVSYLTPELEREWDLSSFQAGFMLSALFAGALAGSLVTGWVSDTFGRRTAILFGMLLSCICKALLLASTNWWTVSLLLFVTQNGSAASNIAFTLYLEFVKPPQRATQTMVFCIWWTIGSIVQVLFSWYTLEFLNWKYMILFHIVPAVLFFFIMIFSLPESIIFNHSKKKYFHVVNHLYKMNPGINEKKKSTKSAKQNQFEIEKKINQYLLERIDIKQIKDFFAQLESNSKLQKKFKYLMFQFRKTNNSNLDNLANDQIGFSGLLDTQNDEEIGSISANDNNNNDNLKLNVIGKENENVNENSDENENNKLIVNENDNSEENEKENKKEKEGSEEKSIRFRDLFSKKYRKLFIFFSISYVCISFAYYGIILLSPISFEEIKQSKFLNKYVLNLFQTISEIPGLFLGIYICKYLSRKTSLLLLLAISLISNTVIIFYRNTYVFTILLMLMRGCLLAFYMLIILFIIECFPTLVRNRALGVITAIARMGTILVPYTVYNSLGLNFPLAIYLAITAVNIFVISQIKAKTKNKSLE